MAVADGGGGSDFTADAEFNSLNNGLKKCQQFPHFPFVLISRSFRSKPAWAPSILYIYICMYIYLFELSLKSSE